MHVCTWNSKFSGMLFLLGRKFCGMQLAGQGLVKLKADNVQPNSIIFNTLTENRTTREEREWGSYPSSNLDLTGNSIQKISGTQIRSSARMLILSKSRCACGGCVHCSRQECYLHQPMNNKSIGPWIINRSIHSLMQECYSHRPMDNKSISKLTWHRVVPTPTSHNSLHCAP